MIHLPETLRKKKSRKNAKVLLRKRSTTTSDRNLQIRGILSTDLLECSLVHLSLLLQVLFVI